MQCKENEKSCKRLSKLTEVSKWEALVRRERFSNAWWHVQYMILSYVVRDFVLRMTAVKFVGVVLVTEAPDLLSKHAAMGRGVCRDPTAMRDIKKRLLFSYFLDRVSYLAMVMRFVACVCYLLPMVSQCPTKQRISLKKQSGTPKTRSTRPRIRHTVPQTPTGCIIMAPLTINALACGTVKTSALLSRRQNIPPV